MTVEDGGRRTRPRGRLTAALALVLAAGCGGESGPARLPVSGRVTLDGQPLSTGAITFLPSGPGHAVGGRIEDGTFSLGRPEGPGPGSYKVEIVSVQPTGKQVTSPDDPTATIEEVRDVIPPRYNLATTLLVEVKPEETNIYQFDLVSRDDSPKGRRVAGSASRGRRRSPAGYVE